VNQAERKSFDDVKARRLDAMSDAGRAEFDEAYKEERRSIEIAERSDRNRS